MSTTTLEQPVGGPPGDGESTEIDRLVPVKSRSGASSQCS